MSKGGRKTIGNEMMDQLNGNPFELLTTPIQQIDKSTKETNGSAVNRNSANSIVVIDKITSKEKERMTVQISKNTIERVKDCVYWNRSTVAQFVEEALDIAIELAEKENGKPFDKRRSELKPGRPTK